MQHEQPALEAVPVYTVPELAQIIQLAIGRPPNDGYCAQDSDWRIHNDWYNACTRLLMGLYPNRLVIVIHQRTQIYAYFGINEAISRETRSHFYDNESIIPAHVDDPDSPF